MTQQEPDALERIIMAAVCEETVSGWLWYCDDHDTHGNADTEAEAKAMAKAHIRLRQDVDPCPITIWQRTPRVPMKWPEGSTGGTIGELHDSMATGETRKVDGTDVTRLD